MAPSGDLHEEISRLVTGRSGREVQRILDSTAHTHGGRHREDSIHSLGGLAVELMRRGELTPEKMLDGALHLATDEAFSRAMKGLPIRGPMRQPTKQLLQASLVQALKSARRARR